MKPTSIHNHPPLLLLRQHAGISAATFKQLHAHLLATGLALHSFPLSLLLRRATLLLGPDYALTLLRSSSRPATTFLYNTLISSLAPRHPHCAWALYSRLARHATQRPNAHSYPSLLKACASLQSSPLSCFHGRALHAHVVRFLGEHRDAFVLVGLLSLYSSCGKIASCRQLFDKMPQPDLACWNCLMGAYLRAAREATACENAVASGSSGNSLCMEVLWLFREMTVLGVGADEISLVAVIGACGEIGFLYQGTWAHSYVLRNGGLALNCHLGTALIEMYAKCGRLELACQVFDSLSERDAACCNAMICGLASHGQGDLAIQLFERMVREGPKVDDATMVSVLCACSHSGLVDEGRRLFSEMKSMFGIEPKSEHYGCLVDLLGRAGHVQEAEDVFRRMPIRPTAMMYRSLLAACKIHGCVEMGENLAQGLVEVEPGQGGNYVMLSNIYANNYEWNHVKEVREAMKVKGINKNAGVSIIEIGGGLHEFTNGDRIHACTLEIYNVIASMGYWLHA